MGICSASTTFCCVMLFISTCGLGRVVEGKCLNSSYFELTFTKHTSIDKSWFSNCTIGREFNISNNEITIITNESLNILWNVQLMDLSNNNISVIESGAFDIMRSVRYIYLSHNDISDIPVGFFNNKFSLEIVDFSYNKITHIPRAVLEFDLPSIRQIIVSHNYITSFEPWGSFRNNVPLFDVSYNNISTFTNVYNYTYDKKSVYDRKTTDLRFNQLTTWHDWFIMQYKAPNSTTNAVESALVELGLDMRDNPWFCDCNVYNMTQRMKNSFFRWSDHQFLKIKCPSPASVADRALITEVKLSELVCNVTDDCPAGCFCQDRPDDQILNVDCRGVGLTAIPATVPKSPYDRISLQLDNNFITEFRNVTYLPFIYSVTIANNSLKSIPDYVMHEIASKREHARIDLRHNSLTSIPREAQNMKYEHAQLEGNNLECNCDMLQWMVSWIKNAANYKDKTLSCTFEDKVHKIVDLNEKLLNCSNIGSIILVVVLSIVCLLVLILLITAKRCPYETKVLLYKILRIHPADKYQVDKTTDKEYDMYVCYDNEDIYVRQWVKNQLFKQLENKKPFYKLCVAERNLPAGAEAEGRLQLIEESRRILIILSKDFELNAMCKYETYQAETLEQNHGRVMYLLYDKCAEEDAQKNNEKYDQNADKNNEKNDKEINDKNNKKTVNENNDKNHHENNEKNDDKIKGKDDGDESISNSKRKRLFRLLSMMWAKPEETMKGRKVFHFNDKMLWSKLRYELPRKPLQKKAGPAAKRDEFDPDAIAVNMGFD